VEVEAEVVVVAVDVAVGGDASIGMVTMG